MTSRRLEYGSQKKKATTPPSLDEKPSEGGSQDIPEHHHPTCAPGSVPSSPSDLLHRTTSEDALTMATQPPARIQNNPFCYQ